MKGTNSDLFVLMWGGGGGNSHAKIFKHNRVRYTIVLRLCVNHIGNFVIYSFEAASADESRHLPLPAAQCQIECKAYVYFFAQYIVMNIIAAVCI
jgi:hypothetical protein